MSNRSILNPTRVREAHQSVGDDQRAATARVFHRQSVGETTIARDQRREATLRRYDDEGHRDLPPAVIQARITRDAVVPGSLALVCPRCGTVPGEFCTTAVRSVCAARVQASLRESA